MCSSWQWLITAVAQAIGSAVQVHANLELDHWLAGSYAMEFSTYEEVPRNMV